MFAQQAVLRVQQLFTQFGFFTPEILVRDRVAEFRRFEHRPSLSPACRSVAP